MENHGNGLATVLQCTRVAAMRTRDQNWTCVTLATAPVHWRQADPKTTISSIKQIKSLMQLFLTLVVLVIIWRVLVAIVSVVLMIYMKYV
jgi:hypothetical protein